MDKKMTIQSKAFENGQPIPKKHTGEGEDVSPELSWRDVPSGTKELALIMDDPDAPRGTWVHWVIARIPPATPGLKENISKAEQLKDPSGAIQGNNSWPTIGYRGPMPPPGHGVHHYHFKLYALDTVLPVKPGLTKEDLLAAMRGHVLAEAETVGTYERKK